MDFFAHQAQARKQSRRMIALFAVAVIAIVGLIDLAFLFAFGHEMIGSGDVAGSMRALLVLSLFVAAAIGAGSLYRIATLRGGGGAVARQLGATPVPENTSDFAYRRLRNVVEEIAIASGVPVPEVYVLEEDAGINAFAAGYSPADAAVTVTRGALDKLDRDELQGVIAHEFSHVLNGDMRLNIRLIGVIFGILVMATIGRKILEVAGRGRGRSTGGIVLFGAALFAAGYIGVLFARMIKASVSRHREYLADASAVQFTRQTDGIAGALKKIGGLAEGSRLSGDDREEVAHMLFGDGVGYSALFATHPPLVERIKRLQPRFDPAEFAAIAAAWSQPVRVGDVEASNVSIAGFAPAAVAARLAIEPAHAPGRLPPADAVVRVEPERVSRQVGNPGTDDHRAAGVIHHTIPDPLREAAYRQERAMAVVFALLLAPEAVVRSRQLDAIERRFDAGTRVDADALAVIVAQLHPLQHLPLAALAFPALRRRPRPQLDRFLAMLEDLIRADDHVSLSEYCLARLVRLQVIEALDPASARVVGRYKLPQLAGELADVFAILAQHGHGDARVASRAYRLGLHETLPGSTAPYAPPADWIAALDRALPKLDLLAPAGKELVVRGLTLAIGEDGVMSVAEAELLRTICAALHCPLPPILQR